MKNNFWRKIKNILKQTEIFYLSLEYSKIKFLIWYWNFELAMVLWYVTQAPQTHDVQEKIHNNLQILLL